MMVIPSLWVCFSFIDVPNMGIFFNLQHTHPGVDKSSQVKSLGDLPMAGCCKQFLEVTIALGTCVISCTCNGPLAIVCLQ